MQGNFESFVRNVIYTQGYLPLDQFLKMNAYFYYDNKTSIGAKADFITAPEISQLFGEMIAISIVKSLQKNNVTSFFNIVELGPGNGVMMSDILRTLNKFPSIKEKLKNVCLVESSSILIAKQQAKLQKFKNLNISWLKNVNDYKANLFTIFVSNEFFDALPIKQYARCDDALYENVVTVDKDGKFILSLKLSNDNYFQDADCSGDFFEYSVSRNDLLRFLGCRLQNNGGQILAIDYGYIDKLGGSSLQALYRHKKVGILDNLGEADITSLVDFGAFKKILHSLSIKSKVMSQGEFLNNSGIKDRIDMLVKSGADRSLLDRQLHRLIDDNEMGRLFKVLEAILV